MRSLLSFSSGFCGGIDGLRSAHLLDLVVDSTAEAGLRLRQSITYLSDKIPRGGFSDYDAKLLCSVSHTALRKRGSIRQVAVGNVFRHLAAKVCFHAVSRAVSYELSTKQFGVSVKGGAEAAVHVVRKFISNKIDSDEPYVIVKQDMKNEFTTRPYFTYMSGPHARDC